MTGANQDVGRRPSTNSLVGLVFIIAFVIAALAFIDSALEKAEQSDLESQAQQAHTQGAQLVKQGKLDPAIELLRKAHTLERADTLYELDLIDALIAAKRSDDAEPLMNEILLREPDDGRANLSAARLALEKGKSADAISYYHRAIYGDWPQSAPAHRMAARMQLIHLLAVERRKQELLAELLPIEEEAKANIPIQRELGHLFLFAGSPNRAAEAYRAMIDRDPKDADAHSGLGEAELEMGDYRKAHAAFVAALRYKPHDSSIQKQVDLSNALNDLDPTPRRLASIEKYRRSIHILQLAYDNLNACLAQHSGAQSADAGQALSTARDALAAKPPSHASNELSESVLGIAEKTWQARVAVCGASVSPDDDALRLLVEKLAQ
ncbi:MAG TPA: tetratricopeptide repeat protein [Bryobacteraceae bacterium]|jgi:tetratricopeptide (TPR) repeat protein